MSSLPPPQAGVFAALWIPTDARHRLMKAALTAHLDFLRASAVDGVLALGSSGEFPRFTLEQREELLADIAELAGSLTVLANVSSIRVDEAIALGRSARGLGLLYDEMVAEFARLFATWGLPSAAGAVPPAGHRVES